MAAVLHHRQPAFIPPPLSLSMNTFSIRSVIAHATCKMFGGVLRQISSLIGLYLRDPCPNAHQDRVCPVTWRKLLVTDQDRFNAGAGQHPGQDSEGNTSKRAHKNEDQKSKIKLREQHGRGDGNVRPPQGESKLSEVTVSQLICGNTERVQDVVMASSDDYDDEVEACRPRSQWETAWKRGHDCSAQARGHDQPARGRGHTKPAWGRGHMCAEWRRR